MKAIEPEVRIKLDDKHDLRDYDLEDYDRFDASSNWVYCTVYPTSSNIYFGVSVA